MIWTLFLSDASDALRSDSGVSLLAVFYLCLVVSFVVICEKYENNNMCVFIRKRTCISVWFGRLKVYVVNW